jgi:hypothetical protein
MKNKALLFRVVQRKKLECVKGSSLAVKAIGQDCVYAT